MQIEFLERHRGLKDTLSILFFVIAVVVGAWLINLLLFRSFSVSGPSMEPTLFTGDRLIVNRVPVTWSHLRGQAYVPKRGEVIVFKNPHFLRGMQDEYIVKRVIGLPGERVVLRNGELAVYNKQSPKGFNPDKLWTGPTNPTDGDADRTVPADEIFVVGDHRQEGYSFDSRNGLGTVPFDDIVGPVAFRIYPFTGIRTF